VTLHGSSSTLIRISEAALSPYASRGLTQTLAHIQQAGYLRRTINGDLTDFSSPLFQKYTSVISGNDQNPPSIDGIWPGQTVQVECMTELSYVTSEGSAERPVVTDSSRTDGDLTYYRPVLDMKVTAFDQSFDEWAAQWSWSITLEEI
jgi:hypothetical protein